MDFSRVLSESDIERIHDAAEELLETTGFKVLDAEALRICAAAGAQVEEASSRVRFPKAFLRELLARVPLQYTIGSVSGQEYTVGGETPWGLAIVTDPWVIDYATQAPRRPVLEDIRRHTLLAQRLDPIAAISRMDFPVADEEGPSSSLLAWETYLLHTTKHHYFPSASPESNAHWRNILRILSRGEDPAEKRLCSVMVAVISPLSISGENVALMRLAFDCGAPIVPTICPMAGTTAPYTLAGTLLLGHAENLAMAALTQLLQPGHPFLYTFGPSVTDLRSGHDLYYTLDKVLWKTASVQLAKHCRLPVSAECGGAMTHRYDPQLGMEGALFMLSAVSSGADMLSGFGSCYTAMGMSAEMMLIQEAWMEAARFLHRGLPVDELRLGLERLQEAGPGGSFMTDDLTMQFMHGSEFFTNDLFDHAPAGKYEKSMLERAHDRVEALLADAVSPVPGDIQEGLLRYFHDLLHPGGVRPPLPDLLRPVSWRDEAVSRVILGTVQLGLDYGIANTAGKPDDERARAIVAAAWEGGVRHFDTAQAYGDSEAVLGRALRELGIAREARITSKISRQLSGDDLEAVEAAIERSFELLGVERLWCMMLHIPDWLDYWDAGLGDLLRGYREAGRIEHLGVSLSPLSDMPRCLAHPEMEILQVPASAWDRRPLQRGHLDAARAAGKLACVRSVYLQGLLTLPPEAIAERLPAAEEAARRWQGLAAHCGMPVTELALRFALSLDTPLVIGADSPEQVRETLALARLEPLPPEIIGALDAILDPVIDEFFLEPWRWPPLRPA